MTKYKFIKKEEALKLYKHNQTLYIGYAHKDGGAFWNFYTFENYVLGLTSEEKFRNTILYIKQNLLPHTQIKYKTELKLKEEFILKEELKLKERLKLKEKLKLKALNF